MSPITLSHWRLNVSVNTWEYRVSQLTHETNFNAHCEIGGHFKNQSQIPSTYRLHWTCNAYHMLAIHFPCAGRLHWTWNAYHMLAVHFKLLYIWVHCLPSGGVILRWHRPVTKQQYLKTPHRKENCVWYQTARCNIFPTILFEISDSCMMIGMHSVRGNAPATMHFSGTRKLLLLYTTLSEVKIISAKPITETFHLFLIISWISNTFLP